MGLPAEEQRAQARACPCFVTRIRLYSEPMAVELADGEVVEREVPVMSVAFDYAGMALPASDRRPRFFVAGDDGMAPVDRDLAGEAQVQCLLESFGAVELGCVDHMTPELDSEADYIVSVSDNVHAYCSFSAHAVSELRARGCVVSIDPNYPYQVVDPGASWYAEVGAEEEKTDWFSLELGVEIDGKRVSLLPALVELIEQSSGQGSLLSLTRAPARFRAVSAGPNLYVAVPPERLERLLAILVELYDGGPGRSDSIQFPDILGAIVAGLNHALDDQLCWSGDTGVVERGAAIASAKRAPRAEPPAGLRATLRGYQQQGLDWLTQLAGNSAGGILADDMGLGKTLQTIAHLVLEKESGRSTRPSLIVLPTSLIGNWQRELAKFAPSLKLLVLHGAGRKKQFSRIGESDVVLITYPLLVRDQDALAEHGFHSLILDEAQAIKNRRSQAHRAVQRIESEHRLCLTGTPVENNLDELHAIMDFANPGLLGDIESFRSRFRIPIERDGNQAELERLRARVAPFILRRMKEEVARDLPPKTELVRAVELCGDQRELYESIRVAAHSDVRKAIRKKGFAASTIAILDALMKLRQVCCDPRLVGFQAAERVTRSAKYELLMEFLPEQLALGRRVLVFSQFTSMLALISQGLLERGIRHAVLTGQTQDRQGQVDAFQNGERDVFLISLKAGGAGLNLTRADTVVHYDPWWNAAAQAQATDRAHRIGQTQPVFVHNLIAAGSVEERMLRLQQRKRFIAESILGQRSAENSRLSLDDVEDLFGPLGEE